MSDDPYNVTADELRQFIERYEQLEAEKKDIKRTNIAREAIKKAIAASKYRNQVRNQPAPEAFLPPA